MSLAATLTLNIGSVLVVTTFARIVEILAGWRQARFTGSAWLGLFGWFLLHTLLELYRLAPSIGSQILVWQGSLIVMASVLATFNSVMSDRLPLFRPFTLVAAGVATVTLAMPGEWAMHQKTAELALCAVILVLSLEGYLSVKATPQERMARSIWAVLLLASAMTAFQVLDCQLLHNPHAPRIEGSSCGQIYGWTGDWGYSLITLAGMVLVLCDPRNRG